MKENKKNIVGGQLLQPMPINHINQETKNKNEFDLT